MVDMFHKEARMCAACGHSEHIHLMTLMPGRQWCNKTFCTCPDFKQFPDHELEKTP